MIMEKEELRSAEGEQEASGNQLVPSEEEYDDYEIVPAEDNGGRQVADWADKGIQLAQEVSGLADKFNTGVSLAQNVSDVYRDCLSLHEHRKELECMTQAQIVKTAAKLKATETFMNNTFAERNGALQEHYKVLDDALKKGDRELIIAAMSSIGGIVTKSPLADIEKLCENFDDSIDDLLDLD